MSTVTGGETRRVVDALGTAVTVPVTPRRIVSLVPSLSETLWWLRVAGVVVGVTDYCTAPPHGFPHARRVAGTKTPDVDVVIALEPDLVLANQEENRERDVTALRDAGVPVYVTAPRSVAAAGEMLEEVGRLVGAAKAGAGLAQAIHRASEIAVRRRPQGPLRAFVPVWRQGRAGDDPDAERWWATGRDTYAADLLARCGFAVLPSDEGGRYPHVTLGEARGLDPDVVLLPDEPYAFDESDRAVFAGWRARVRRIDGTQLTWYGPRTPTAVGELTRLARTLARRSRR